ncbi:phenylacetate--CoA ligase family protein, partial [Roseateles sp. GG27B]
MLHGLTPAAIAADIRLAGRASAQAIAARQTERLQLLLQAARAAPFYRRVLQALDRTFAPGDIPLQALPVLSKPDLMRNFADHVTDPQLTLAGLSAFCADPQRIGRAYLGKYWVWESSGSTGQSAHFVQDARAMAVYDALEASRRDSPRPWARLWDPLYLTERFAWVGAIDGHFASQVSVQRLRLAQPWLTAR